MNQKSEILIQRLNASDILKFRSLNEVFAHAFEDPERHLSRLPSDEYLKGLLAKPHVIVLTAIKNENVIGGIVAYVLDKYEQEISEIYLYDLAVAEEFRRQGIARALIESLKVIAKGVGASVLFVQADREDEPAIKLYQSLGIQEEPFHFDITIP
jgi:aminoglycoside 3-N-acetyltransferase I